MFCDDNTFFLAFVIISLSSMQLIINIATSFHTPLIRRHFTQRPLKRTNNKK